MHTIRIVRQLGSALAVASVAVLLPVLAVTQTPAGAAEAPSPGAAEITLGGLHQCVLTTADAADCWGGNTFGQAEDRSGPFTDLAVGDTFSCGLRTDGTIECWGREIDPVLHRGAPSGTFVQIFGSGHRICGYTGSGLRCEGPDGDTVDAATPGFDEVTEGPAGCFVDYPSGSPATPYSTSILCPSAPGDYSPLVPLPPMWGVASNVVEVGTGFCGLALDGDVQCLFEDAPGKWKSSADPTPPTPQNPKLVIQHPPALTTLAATPSLVCGLDLAGGRTCYSPTDLATPVVVEPGPFTSIFTDPFRPSAICWGRADGSLDCPSLTSSLPTVSAGWTQIPPGYQSTRSLLLDHPDIQGTVTLVRGPLPKHMTMSRSDGTISGIPDAAGQYPYTLELRNYFGAATFEGTLDVSEPGDHPNAPKVTYGYTTMPVGVQASRRLKVKPADTPHTVSLVGGELPAGVTILPDGTLSGTAATEGQYSYTVEVRTYYGRTTYQGTLDVWGPGDDPANLGTQQLVVGSTAVALGGAHSCVLTKTKGADCWGRNDYGQAVDQPGPFHDLAVGPTFSCGLRATNGGVQCWGAIDPHDISQPFGEIDVVVSPPSEANYKQIWVRESTLCAFSDHLSPVQVCVDGLLPDGTVGEHRVQVKPITGGDVEEASEGEADCFFDYPSTTVHPGVTWFVGQHCSDHTTDLYDVTFGGVVVTDGYCGLSAQGEIECLLQDPVSGVWRSSAEKDPDLERLDLDLPGTYKDLVAQGMILCGIEKVGPANWHAGPISCFDLRSGLLTRRLVGPYSSISDRQFSLGGMCGATTQGKIDCWDLPLNSPGIPPTVATGHEVIPVGAQPTVLTVTPTDIDHTASIIAGALPPGLTLLPDGTITGVASAPGDYGFTVEVRNYFSTATAGGSIRVFDLEGDTSSTPMAPGAKLVAVGAHHACALTTTNGADCWSEDASGNTDGQAEDRPGPFTNVVVGDMFSCGHRPDRSVECWGEDFAEPDDPQDDLDYVPDGKFDQIWVEQPKLPQDLFHPTPRLCGLVTGRPASTSLSTRSCGGVWPNDIETSVPLAFGGLTEADEAVDGPSRCFADYPDAPPADPNAVYATQRACLQAESGPVVGVASNLVEVDGGFCGLSWDGGLVCTTAPGLDFPGTYWSLAAVGSQVCGIEKVRPDAWEIGPISCFEVRTGLATHPVTGSYSSIVSEHGRTTGFCAASAYGPLACWGGLGNVGTAPTVSAGYPPAMAAGQQSIRRLTVAPADIQYSVSLVGGALPAGVTLSPDGTLTGAPAVAGHYDHTLEVRSYFGTTTLQGTLDVAVTVAADDVVVTYGDEVLTTYRVLGLPDGDSFSTNPKCVINAEQFRNAGTYVIRCVNAETASGLPITFVDGKLIVKKKPLSIKPKPQNVQYGSPPPPITINPPALISGDSLLRQPTCGVDGGFTGSGQYTISCSDADAGPNYEIIYEESPLVVEATTVTVRAPFRSRLYGAPNPTLPASYEGLVAADLPDRGASCTTGAVVDSNIGNHLVTCGGAEDPNYEFVYETGTLSIVPAPLVVTADNKARTYGQSNPALTASYSGLRAGDTPADFASTVSCTTGATPATSVGSYPITCSGPTPNYAATFHAGTLTIGKAPTTLAVARLERSLLSVRAEATLTRTADGAPVGGKTITFRVGGTTLCSAVTNSQGKASCTVLGIVLVLGGGTYTGSFGGDGDHVGASGTGRV